MKQQISYQMGDGHNVTGEIPVSYDNFVFTDIEENIVFKKSGITKHYDRVMSTIGDYYNGLSKYNYGNILQALKTIVDAKRNRMRRSGTSNAIAFLHQEMKLSPVTIQNILSLFNVKITSGKILDESGKFFAIKTRPEWMNKFLGGMV